MRKWINILKRTIIYQYLRWIKFRIDRKRRCSRTEKLTLKDIFGVKVFSGKDRYEKLFRNLDLDEYSITIGSHFFYSIDTYKTVAKYDRVFGNLPIDYSQILGHSLEELKETSCGVERRILESLQHYSKRIYIYLESKNSKYINSASFLGISEREANGFQDALQRILFLNQNIWQCGHRLNGLGRLDYVLGTYYESDILSGKITYESAKEMLKDFLSSLHYYYWFKGDVLSGDTGQLIALGGCTSSGEYFSNDLTYLFIDVIAEMKKPDPKLLLRTSKNMPRELMGVALNCIQTGCGSPLLANDDVIIPALTRYGYEVEDSRNYVTSACWEPLISGKSSEQNNALKINFASPMYSVLKKNESITDFDELKEKYYIELEKYISHQINSFLNKKYQEAPLLSIFIERKSKEDISKQSAKYHDFGITTVGLGNVVNSFLIMNKFVWIDKCFSYREMRNFCLNDYKDSEMVRQELLASQNAYWGNDDDDDVVSLTNEIINMCKTYVSRYQTDIAKFKMGLSSPDYISEGRKVGATPDGRKANSPLSVHISSGCGLAYTTLIRFASMLDYSGININGNVVDLMVSPNFVGDNFEKMLDFIMLSNEVGFFEMQMNVVSSEVLLAARKNPEAYSGLIVRVWGFSAYFVELPEEYKDLLIERALKNEGIA